MPKCVSNSFVYYHSVQIIHVKIHLTVNTVGIGYEIYHTVFLNVYFTFSLNLIFMFYVFFCGFHLTFSKPQVDLSNPEEYPR